MMYQVFLSILETFIVFGFGALAWRLRMIKSSDLGRLTRLTLDMFFPMLTFSTITRNFDPSQLNELWVMPLLGIVIMAVGALAGWYLKRFLRWRTPGRLGTFHHICAINNYVFLPIIILQNVWGGASRRAAAVDERRFDHRLLDHRSDDIHRRRIAW